MASRWVHFAALSIVFGGALFWHLPARGALSSVGVEKPLRTTMRLLRVAAPVAVVSGIARLAATIAYATGGFASLGDPAVLRVFFFETPFGVPAGLRLALMGALLAIAFLPLKIGVRLTSWGSVGAVLLVSQAWLGHADEGGYTPYGIAMLVAYAVHVLFTAAWIGGLPPLAFILAEARREPQGLGYGLLRRYSALATVSVILIVLSGSANTSFHDGGHLRDLWATAYGTVLLTKVCLVAAMLGLGALNRFVLMPPLRGVTKEAQIRRLQASLGLETALALLVLAAAAVLGITPPPR